MIVKLGAKLPDDEANGLVTIAHHLLNDPHRKHLVLAVVDCGLITENVDEGTRTPLARICRIEALQVSDYRSAEVLMRSAMAARHGSTELPLDEQRDLFSLFHPGAMWEGDGNGGTKLAEDFDDGDDEPDTIPADDLIEEKPAEEPAAMPVDDEGSYWDADKKPEPIGETFKEIQTRRRESRAKKSTVPDPFATV